ncbi:MAG: DNA polymerase IV [Phycisphaerales bacterium]|nr:DNA polymerase IV [Phycisphaerales bacterium]
MDRTILHVDLDAFFASVEQRDDPALRGRPVLVGGTGRRGVVAAASYEARAFGCHSAQPSIVARRLCPQAIFVKGRHDVYREVSRQVFDILETYTPLIQPLSIDEAFLDVTGSLRLFGTALDIARDIRTRVRRTTDLTISVGVAPNKFLAKLASELEKPDGLCVIEADLIREILGDRSVRILPGVGPAGERALAKLGVRTLEDLRRTPRDVLRDRLGDYGETLHDRAHGIDDRPVVPDREAKSISHECTFHEDLDDPDLVEGVILDHAQRVATRLRAHERHASTVSLKIRFGDFQTITRARTIDATRRTDHLARTALDLFRTWTRSEGFRPVRLIGVQASGFDHAPQGMLFGIDEDRRQHALDHAADEILRKFGKGAITRGTRARP